MFVEDRGKGWIILFYSFDFQLEGRNESSVHFDCSLLNRYRIFCAVE